MLANRSVRVPEDGGDLVIKTIVGPDTYGPTLAHMREIYPAEPGDSQLSIGGYVATVLKMVADLGDGDCLTRADIEREVKANVRSSLEAAGRLSAIREAKLK